MTPLVTAPPVPGEHLVKLELAKKARASPGHTKSVQRRMAELESDDCGNAACVISAFYYLGT